MNEALQYCGKTKKNRIIKIDENFVRASKTNCPESALLYMEFNALLGKSIQKLNQNEMMVFLYRDIEEMPVNEICQVLKGNFATIKSRILRGRRKLRKSYIARYLTS